MKNRFMYVSITIVALILGVILAVQFRANRSVEQGMPYGRAQELTNELNQLEKDNKKLEEEISDLNIKLEQINMGQTQAMQAIEDELAKARLYAGVVAMGGPGIEVIMDNPPGDRRAERISFLLEVTDIDLLRVINELNGAGAEALSINGQRVVAGTEIRRAGSFINVNLTRMSAPYRILAIGKPDNLRSALEISGGLAEYLRGMGIQFEIEVHDNAIVPAYGGKLEFQYAKPTKKG